MTASNDLARPISQPTPATIDWTALERYLKILADPSRLQLLHVLRKPRTIDEIQLIPHRSLAGQRPERPMTRQAVRNHLYTLTDAGLVRMRLARRESRRSLQEFIIDRSRIFGIIEDLREIARVEATDDIDPAETIGVTPHAPVTSEVGPRLVHVNGPNESRALALDSRKLREGRGWVIGRGAACQLRLDYDPYASKEHAEILRDAQGYKVLDLRSARNSTSVNWEPLVKGGERRLRRGDLLRVGRSLLLFVDE